MGSRDGVYGEKQKHNPIPHKDSMSPLRALKGPRTERRQSAKNPASGGWAVMPPTGHRGCKDSVV